MRLALITLALLASSSAHANLLASSGDATNRESTVNGALTGLADPAGAGLLISLTTDPKSDTIRGLDVGGWPLLAAELVTLDATGAVVATAELTYQGAPVLVAEGLAYAPSGRLLVAFGTGFDYEFYESGHVGEVDPATGIIDPSTVITLSGYHNADADVLEFIGGVLYMTDNRMGEGTSLYTVSTSTGATTLIGLVQGAAGVYQVTDLALEGSTLYGETSEGQLISIDRRTGAATPVGPVRTTIVTGLTVGPDESCKKKSCAR